jgi:phosphate/sulfate permease
MPSTEQVWLILTIVFSFLMSFSIGSNDAANALSTSYGSKALRVSILIPMGGIAVFIGSMFCSSQVAATLTSKIIPKIQDSSEDDQN